MAETFSLTFGTWFGSWMAGPPVVFPDDTDIAWTLTRWCLRSSFLMTWCPRESGPFTTWWQTKLGPVEPTWIGLFWAWGTASGPFRQTGRKSFAATLEPVQEVSTFRRRQLHEVHLQVSVSLLSGSPKTGWFLSSQRLLGSPLEPWQGGGPLNKRKGRNIQVKDLLLPRLLLTITSILLMVQKSCDHHLGCVKPVVNNEINYQPQLVQDFWTINSRWCVFVCSSKNYRQKPLKNGFFVILKGWEFMGVLCVCVFGVDSGAVVVSFQGG